MNYQIHKSIAITAENDKPLVMVSRSESFNGTLEELKDHLDLFNYDVDDVARKEFDKLLPRPKHTPVPTITDDKIPF